jgi:hypothetical protein
MHAAVQVSPTGDSREKLNNGDQNVRYIGMSYVPAPDPKDDLQPVAENDDHVLLAFGFRTMTNDLRAAC